MPCSAMIRAASCASARRRFSARGGSFFIVSENGLRTVLWSIRRIRVDVLRPEARIAHVTFLAGQLLDAEVFEHRVDVRVASAAGAAVDLDLDDAFGRGAASFGYSAQCFPHVVDPDGYRGARAFLAVTEGLVVVAAHPDTGDDAVIEAVEPGVDIQVGGAGLAAEIGPPEREGTTSGTARDHVLH